MEFFLTKQEELEWASGTPTLLSIEWEEGVPQAESLLEQWYCGSRRNLSVYNLVWQLRCHDPPPLLNPYYASMPVHMTLALLSGIWIFYWIVGYLFHHTPHLAPQTRDGKTNVCPRDCSSLGPFLGSAGGLLLWKTRAQPLPRLHGILDLVSLTPCCPVGVSPPRGEVGKASQECASLKGWEEAVLQRWEDQVQVY